MAVYQSSGVTTNRNLVAQLEQNLSNSVTQLNTVDATLKSRLDTVQGADTVVGSIAKATKDLRVSLEALIQNLSDTTIATLQSNQETLLADSNTAGSIAYKLKQLTGSAPEILDSLEEIANSINNDANFSETMSQLLITKIAEAKAELKDGVSEDLDTMKEIADKISSIYTEITNLISSTAEQVLNDAKAYSDANNSYPVNSVVPIDADNKITLAAPALGKIVTFGMAYVDNADNVNNLDLITCTYDITADGVALEGRVFKIVGDDGVSYEGRNALVNYFTKFSNIV
jgi:uncharacterized phage infection (PIP) family protein YhgE